VNQLTRSPSNPARLTPRVYVEVDSLQPRDTIRPAVVEWLDDTYRKTVAPLVRSLRLTSTVGVLAEPPDRWRRLRNEQVWTDVLATISRPDGKFLALIASDELDDRGIIVNADFKAWDKATRLWMLVHAGTASRADWPRFQEQLIGHMIAAAEVTGASTGFISSDEPGPAETSYELQIDRDQDLGLAESDRWLRGVFWCTLLSQGHLDALGGIERVEREAPVARTRRLRGRNGPLLLLQASDDLDGFDAATLAPLREFLAPVLPPPSVRPEGPTRPPEPPRPTPSVEMDDDADGDVTVQLTFRGHLGEDDRAALDSLLDAWYLLAVHGIFGGFVHNMDAPAFEENSDTSECVVGIDLGSAGDDALQPLVQLLLATADELGAPLLRIRTGGQYEA